MAVKSAPVQITDSIFLPDLFKTICGKMLSNLAISFTNWHTNVWYGIQLWSLLDCDLFSEQTGNMLIEVMALDMPSQKKWLNFCKATRVCAWQN